MKTKRDNWIVECENRSQTTNVLNYVHKDDDKRCYYWNYVWYNSGHVDFLDELEDITKRYPTSINRRLIEFDEGYNFEKGSEVEERLKQAGVLELWFEPVYKVEPKTDAIVEEVIEEFRSRSEVGIKKYGTTLEENKLTFNEWVTHMREELMDGILYLKKLEKEYK